MMTGERILIVEDERLIAADIEGHLLDLGYQVAGVAINADDALRAAREQSPDLVLMDIQLRGSIDGTEVARQIRERHDIPIVFVTSHADPTTLERACVSSPYGFLLKPFEGRELAATIETSLYRHREDQKLLQMERWLATTLMSIGDAVFATDVHGRLTFLNPMAERLTGWTRQEALGRASGEVFRAFDAADGSVLADPVQRALREGVVLQVANATRIVHRGGTEAPADFSAAPIRDESGSITGVVLIVRDRTERERAEEERRRMQRKLEEAQRLESLGMLAAGIAHDFNNLLTVILANASIVRDAPSGARELAERVGAIEESAARAADLCKQMPAYAGRGDVATAAVELWPLVDQTARLVKLSLSRTATLAIAPPSTALPIEGDASQLRQVFMNLLINASDAIGERDGRVAITAGTTRMEEGDWAEFTSQPGVPALDYAYVDVSDDGCGMSREVAQRIFDPFFTTKRTGRGLGLAAVLGILRSHGGAVRVRSEVGQGTTFRVILPMAEAPPLAKSSADPSRDEWRGAGIALLVDDDPLVRLALLGMLERLGFEVVQAHDGDEVLPLLTERGLRPSVVLLDLSMKSKHGPETLADIRSVDRKVPVFVMTGHGHDGALARLGDLECAGVLEKPFTLGELRARLMTVLPLAVARIGSEPADA